MVNASPKFSIITAAYNGARFLPHLIDSVLEQDYKNFEHIIVDDGSDDSGATVGVLSRYPHLRWWGRENKGQYATQNEGLEAASGDIVGIINQDDTYAAPDVFSLVAEQFDKHPQWDFVYGRTIIMDADGQVLPSRRVERKFSRWFIRNVGCIPHVSLFFRRELIVENGIFFDPSFKMSGDWDWMIRVVQASRDYGYIPKPFARFRVHPDQKTLSIGDDGFMEENRRIYRTYGINRTVNSILRRYLIILTRMKSAYGILRTAGPVEFSRRVVKYFGKKIRRK